MIYRDNDIADAAIESIDRCHMEWKSVGRCKTGECSFGASIKEDCIGRKRIVVSESGKILLVCGESLVPLDVGFFRRLRVARAFRKWISRQAWHDINQS